MKSLKQKLVSREKVQHTNTGKKLFRLERGLRQHCRITNCQGTLNTQPADLEPPNKPKGIIETSKYKWGEYANKQFEENVSSIYVKIVYWKNNIFLLPTGKGGRCFIVETRLIDAWVRGSPLKNIALKAITIMPNLLLQKPSKASKAKDHNKALEGRLQLWTDGHLAELLKDGETIQSSLRQLNAPKTIFEQLSKMFVEQMQKGNVDSAIKLNMENGILPLTDTKLKLLKQKHPNPAPTTEEVLLPDQSESIHRFKYENINADAVRKAALKMVLGLRGWIQMVGKEFYYLNKLLKVLLVYAQPLLTLYGMISSHQLGRYKFAQDKNLDVKLPFML